MAELKKPDRSSRERENRRNEGGHPHPEVAEKLDRLLTRIGEIARRDGITEAEVAAELAAHKAGRPT